MGNGADTAYPGGDVGHLVPVPAQDHGLKEPGGFYYIHAEFFYPPLFYVYYDVPVAFYSGDVFKV